LKQVQVQTQEKKCIFSRTQGIVNSNSRRTTH